MQKKILYISYINESIRPGYKKKIHNQCQAFSNLGYEALLASRDSEGFFLRRIDTDNEEIVARKTISTYGAGIKKYTRYITTLIEFFDYCDNLTRIYEPDAVYIRRIRPINPWLLSFIKRMRKRGIIVLYEYPTYPWKVGMRLGKQYVSLALDSIMYNGLLKSIDAMVCMGLCKEPLCDVIETMNGIGSDEYSPLATKPTESDDELDLICVCHYSRVHGLEKIVRGLQSYYQKSVTNPIYLHLVGPLDSFERLREYAESLGVSDYVHFYGYQTGDELDKLYRKADVGIDAIALEIRGEDCICGSLKSREYIAKGLPFVCSDMLDIVHNGMRDDRFMYVTSHNDADIDLEKLYEWYRGLNCSPQDIQLYGRDNLSWTAMMKPVAEYIEARSK